MGLMGWTENLSVCYFLDAKGTPQEESIGGTEDLMYWILVPWVSCSHHAHTMKVIPKLVTVYSGLCSVITPHKILIPKH